MDHSLEYVGDYFLGKTAGKATVAGLERLMDDMLAHPEWKPGTAWIHDHTDLDAGTLTAYEVQEIADMCVERNLRLGPGRCAVVVGRDLEFGLSRMWAVYVENRWDVISNVFRSLGEAIAWVSA